MKKVLLLLISLLLVPSVYALGGYTLVSNETFETRAISEFNVSSAQWVIQTTSCKSGTNCLRQSSGGTVYDGWAFSTNTTYNRAAGAGMVIKGWVKDAGSGGGGYGGLLTGTDSIGDRQVAVLYAEASDTRFYNMTYTAGVRSLIQVNGSTTNYVNTWVWCSWNLTGANNVGMNCYTNSGETTIIFLNDIIIGMKQSSGQFGWGGLRDVWFDDFEVYTVIPPPAAAPVISLVNFTSDAPPEATCSYPTNCANTIDTTPSFELATDINAVCRINTADANYSLMSNNCTQNGNFNVSHACTWPTDLAANNYTFYFACNSSTGNANTAPLANAHKAALNITPNLVANTTIAKTSFLGPIFEANRTVYQLNVSINASSSAINFTGVNANIAINGTYYSPTTSTPLNSTVWQFNYSRNQPIIEANNSNYNVSWNYTATFNNSQSSYKILGGNVTTDINSTLAQNQTVYWSFIITNITLSPLAALEGDTITGNWTINALSTFWNYTVTQATYRGINQTSITNVLNVSNQTLGFRFTNITSLLSSGVSNLSFGSVANFSWQYGGETFTRSITGNNSVSAMILTGCQNNSASTTLGHRFDVFDEDTINNRVATDYEVGYVVYNTNAGQNRSYNFSGLQLNNWSICLFPVTASYNARFDMQFGNATAKKNFEILFQNINSTPTNFTLFFPNLSSNAYTTTTIRIHSIAGLGQQNRRVEVYRYYLGSGVYRFITSDITDNLGQITALLRFTDTDYLFNVSTESSTVLDKQFGPMKVLSTPLTLMIGIAQLPGISIIRALRLLDPSLTYTNSTRTFRFTWNTAAVDLTGMLINQLCMEISRKTNASITAIIENNQCANTTVGSLSYGPINFSQTQEWSALAYANITASPQSQYDIDLLTIVEGLLKLKLDGVLWTIILMMVLGTLGLYNPVVAVVLSTVAMAFMASAGVITLGVSMTVGILFLMAMIVVYVVKT